MNAIILPIGHTTDISGRGVGMAAVRQAVREVQGTIVVNSACGQGTEIVIEVPARPAAHPVHALSMALRARWSVILWSGLAACGSEVEPPAPPARVEATPVFELDAARRQVAAFALAPGAIYLVTRDARPASEASNGELIALGRDGVERWRRDLHGNGSGVAAGGGRIYTTAADGRLRAFDEAGAELWTDAPGGTDPLYGGPAANADGLVALHTRDDVRVVQPDGVVRHSFSTNQAAIGHAFFTPSASSDGALVTVLFEASVGLHVVGYGGAPDAMGWGATGGLLAAVSEAGPRSAGGVRVVAEDVIASGGAFTRAGTYQLVVFDRDRELWRSAVPARVDTRPVEGPGQATFVVTSGAAADDGCQLLAFDAQGQRRWTRKLVDEYLAEYQDTVSTSFDCRLSQPIVAAERVIVSGPDGVAAYSLDGERRSLGPRAQVLAMVADGGELFGMSGAAVLRVSLAFID